MNTKKLRQKILDLAIHGKLVAQNPNDEPASELLKRIRAEKEQLIKEGKIKKTKTTDSSHYENVPFEIPNSWEWTTLEEICFFDSGYAFSSDDYRTEGIPLIRISNIKENQISIENCVYIQGEYEEKFQINNGDLLIAMSGATTGKMGIYRSNKIAYLNQRVGNIKVIDPNVLCFEYRNLFLQSKTEELLKLAYGGAQPNISGTMILGLQAPLPPLEEQKRIVEAIDKWFALIDSIENNKADLETTIKQTKNKILDLAIHGKLVAQNPNDEPASELLKRIRAEKEQLIKEGKIKKTKTTDSPHYENVPFEIPSSWEWCKLGDLAFYKKGPFGSSLTKSMFVPKSDNTYKVYEQKNAIQKDHLIGSYFISKEKYKSLYGFAVQPYDIIVSCAGTIGETYVLPLNIQAGIINQALMLIRLYCRDIERFYLLYFDYILKGEAYKESKGTAIKNIPPFDILKNFLIPLPPLEEQKRIVEAIDKAFKYLDAIAESL